MESGERAITMEELAGLIQAQEGEFIIRVEPGKGEIDGEQESIPA